MGSKPYLCIVCERLKARWADKCCNRCHYLVQAEGTHAQYGIPTETETQTRYRVKAKEYNRLIAKGCTQHEIAVMWGMDVVALRGLLSRAKRSGGQKVVSLARGKVDADGRRIVTSETVQKGNDHGGGKWGVTGCKCDPCEQKRGQSRRAQERVRFRPSLGEYRRLQARVEELETELAQLKKGK